MGRVTPKVNSYTSLLLGLKFLDADSSAPLVGAAIKPWIVHKDGLQMLWMPCFSFFSYLARQAAKIQSGMSR